MFPSIHCRRHFASDNGKNAVEKQKVEPQKDKDPTSKESNITTDKKEDGKELTKSQKLMAQIKEAGMAGIISYGLWEVAFWSASIPLVVFSYHKLTGHWPDFTNQEDIAKLSAQAFVYVNFSRLAVPFRIGLALTTTPWVRRHIVDRFLHKTNDKGSKKSL